VEADSHDEMKGRGINREAVMEQSPTLPLGGYVGYAPGKDAATPLGLRPSGVINLNLIRDFFSLPD
jgi:hypothetical protein